MTPHSLDPFAPIMLRARRVLIRACRDGVFQAGEAELGEETGYFFAPDFSTHRLATIGWAAVTPKDAAHGFALGLARRRPELCVALPAHAWLRRDYPRLSEPHHFPDDGDCPHCGAHSQSDVGPHQMHCSDMWVRWGLVDPVFPDLSLALYSFARFQLPPLTDADRAVLRAFFTTLRSAAPMDSSAKVVERLTAVIPGTKPLRRALLKSFEEACFPPPRRTASGRDADSLTAWRGGDGLDEAAVSFYFDGLC